MSVKMSDEEVTSFLNENVTATVITINPNGMPLPAPVWYVNKGPELFFSTQRRLQKAKNLARDPRCVMQVEAGIKYVELRAVIITGKAQELSEAEHQWFTEAFAKKYANLRSSASPVKMPEANRKYYDNPRVYYRVIPEKVKTWDNRKIRVKAA